MSINNALGGILPPFLIRLWSLVIFVITFLMIETSGGEVVHF